MEHTGIIDRHDWSGPYAAERKLASDAVERGDVRVEYRGRAIIVADWEREYRGESVPWGWDYVYDRAIYENLETVLDQIDEDIDGVLEVEAEEGGASCSG
jgi:hypothetical protein